MKTLTTRIPGLLIFELDVHEDSRGWFKENWQRAKQPELKDFYPVQNNVSFNNTRGTTRGIHAEPWDKYVSVTNGKVFAAWVDLREDYEPEIVQLEITPNIAVFVPKGVGNSYQTLEDNTTYTYLVNDHYDPNLIYPALNLRHPGIKWPIDLDQANISEKDLNNPTLENAKRLPGPKALVLGSGQVAKALMQVLKNAHQVTRQQLDFESSEALAKFDYSPYDLVINAVAYTAVDQAESDRARAWQVNALAVQSLATATARQSVKLVHISSDYVFDGSSARPYSESDLVSPLGVYGQSKAAGDIAARTNPNHLVIRTSWVIGDGNNFVRTMFKLKSQGLSPEVVSDQFGRPTFTIDLATAIAHLVRQDCTGTYNVTNSGQQTSWFEIARQTFGEAADNVQPTTSAKYLKAGQSRRPSYSVLDLSKLEATGFTPRTWQAGLTEYLSSL